MVRGTRCVHGTFTFTILAALAFCEIKTRVGCDNHNGHNIML